MRYIAGWNMPGFLPDGSPADFDTVEEAREFLVDEFKSATGHDDSGPIVAEIRALEPGYSTSEDPDGYVYFIGTSEA